MKNVHILFVLLISILIVSCAENRHKILGTTYGFKANEVEILLDATVNNLRIRHVRRKDEYCNSGYNEHLELSGLIGPDSTFALEKLLPKLSKCINDDSKQWIVNNVYLSSGGGFLYDGYKLGELFKKYQVQTVITGGQTCASSCAIAFLGGKYRRMEYDAKLLFHAPYTYNGIAINCEDTGQVADLRNYYINALGNEEGEFLLKRTLSYCDIKTGWTLNSDAAKLFGITKN